MIKYSSKQILKEILDGNEDVLPFLTRKYYPASRRMLRLRGFRDKDTPAIFAEVLMDAFVSLSAAQGENTALKSLDSFQFEEYFFDRLKHFIGEQKKSHAEKNSESEDAEAVSNILAQQKVRAKCVQVLDPEYQDLLYARAVKNLSYEKIADQFKFSNPVIAQYEFNKACAQLEAVITARMNR